MWRHMAPLEKVNGLVLFINWFSHYSKSKKALVQSGIDLEALGNWLDSKWGHKVLLIVENLKYIMSRSSIH